jgi:hypothetical protein
MMSTPLTASAVLLKTRSCSPRAGQVGDQLGGGARVDVEQVQGVDADQVTEGQRLELALRAVADQGHDSAVGSGQLLGGQRRHGGRADGGRDRQLGQQARRAGGHVGQQAEGHHRRQAGGGVLRVAIDVLEGEGAVVGDRHQLDHAVGRMEGQARTLLELIPAQELGFDARRHTGQAGRQALATHQVDEVD